MKDYAEFSKNHLIPELDRVSEEENCDFHEAFEHFVLAHLDGGGERVGATGDSGIDTWREIPNSGRGQTFVLTQAYVPEKSQLDKETPKMSSVGQKGMKDLQKILRLLSEPNTPSGINKEAEHIRNSYLTASKELPEETFVVIKLYLYGRIEKEKWTAKYENEVEKHGLQNTKVKVYGWEEIRNSYWSITNEEAPAELTLEYEELDQLAVSRSARIALVFMRDIYRLFEAYGYSCFDGNIRYSLGPTKINDAIGQTVSTAKGRRKFPTLNNGLVILTTNISGTQVEKKGRKRLGRKSSKAFLLKNPSIANGCQTVTSVFNSLRELPEDEKDVALNEIKVMVKILDTGSLVEKEQDEVVIASNSQNKMSQRSLKSNTRVMKGLRVKFAKFSPPWVCEIKDGEYKSLSSRGRNFKAVYGLPKNKFGNRRTDNIEVALAWLSFSGRAGAASRQKSKLFEDPPDGVFTDVFEQRPNDEGWKAVATGIPLSKSMHLEAGEPEINQLMLAYMVFRQWRYFCISEKVANEILISDYKKKNDGAKPTKENLRELRLASSEYWSEFVIRKGRYLVCSIVAMVLSEKYGPLTGETCKKILRLPEFVDLAKKSGKADIPQTREFSQSKDFESRPLSRIVHATQFSLNNFYKENRNAAQSYAGLARNLVDRDALVELCKYSFDVFERAGDFETRPWAISIGPGKSLADSLPDLSG